MTDVNKDTFTVTDNSTGATYELPVMHGTVGPRVVDVRKFYADTGCFTFDPGYTSTGSCESKITYIDGDEGVLLHRGYPISQLAENASYTEVAYLLLNGELPNKAQLDDFNHTMTYHSMLHEQFHNFYSGFRRDAHPMAIACAVVGAMSAFYHDNQDITDPHDREVMVTRLISKMPTVIAWSYKYSIGQPFMYPRNDLDYASNFLHMLFSTPCEEYKVSPTLAKAMNKILILHADHEQNASTSTVRLAGSSGANPFACIAAGIASLWGPAHGGANEAVLKMLQQIGSKDKVDEFVKRAKDPDDPFRLMGFGHRVYKNYDPRAKIMQETCKEVLDELGIEDEPLLEIAVALEKIALEDEYFIEKKLYPNVDFYSGIIFRAMGIPTEMFTSLFALARTSGWSSQWLEMITDPHMKIGRPRQLFTGTTQRNYVDMKDR